MIEQIASAGRLPARRGLAVPRVIRRYAWLLLPLAYAVVFSRLAVHQHMSFHSYALDQGQFQQAIWNTGYGHFMVNTVKPPNTMAWHFSPGLALLALPYRLWPDARLLLVVQTLALAASGIPLFLYVRNRLGTWPAAALLLAYYLSPSLHEVNLSEFRRITLAVPGIALAWYGLMTRRLWVTAAALAYAVLFKEDVALIPVAMGAFLWLNRSAPVSRTHGIDRAWGTGLALFGMGWLAMALWLAIPTFRGDVPGGTYPQMAYFPFLGERTTAEAVSLLLNEPLFVLRGFAVEVLQRNRLESLLRLLGPVGFLPLLAPAQMLLFAPSLLLLLASGQDSVYMLRQWYAAPILPLVYGAAAVALTQLPDMVRRHTPYHLIIAALAGFVLLSPAPGGARYDATRYIIRPRHRVGHQLLEAIPPGASVSAQTGLVPHLAHRPQVHEFPVALEYAEYVALDLWGNLYPLENDVYIRLVKEILADPIWDIEAEGADYRILRRREDGLPQSEAIAVYGPADDPLIELVGYSLAVENAPGGVYTPVEGETVSLRPGQRLRLELYWRARREMGVDYVVFAHLMGDEGMLLGQWDGQPADVPLRDDVWAPLDIQRTSLWHPGDVVRDVRYVTPDATAAAGASGDLLVGLYHPETIERLPMAGATADGVIADGTDGVTLGRFVVAAG